MNLHIKHGKTSLAGIIILITILTGCRDMFNNPLADKDSGENVTVLLVDFNFITTKLAISLEDLSSGNPIEQEEVEIKFIGPDATNLITFSGNKRTSFNTRTGFLEVGSDPNYVITDQNPLELTVIAISPNYISAPLFVRFTTEGTKNLVIKMVRKFAGKSMSTGAFSEPFDLWYNGLLHSSQLVYMDDISSSSTGTDYEYINLYSTVSAGNLLCNNLNDNIVYSDYGAYFFGLTSGMNLVPPAAPTKNVVLQNGDFVFTSVLRTGTAKCDNGLTVHVERPGGMGGSGVFDYLITFADGQTESGQITCSFPSSSLIEPVYYPASNPAVKVELFGDAQYNFSAAVNLPSPCGATANFTATPKSNLKAYKFITQYSCPNSPVGMGLTILADFRRTGTNDPWTTFEFKEGVCELQLAAGAEYDFRVNIDSEYYSYSLPTDVTKVEAYLRDHQSIDYTLVSLSINDTDTMVTITAAVQLSQGVCDAIQ